MEQMFEILAETALREGQKAAANFGVKFLTLTAAVLASNGITKKMDEQLRPLSDYPEGDERNKQEMLRLLRNAGVSTACIAAGNIVYKLSEVAIEESNFA